jgi:RNA polymerase sigma-70 factor (ECF subfamily)
MTDEEIVKLVQKGDKEKFRLIVEKFERQLFFYIKRMINQPDPEIEDLLQEVFIKVFVNIQGFDNKKHFSSWIYRIAHNKSIDYMKQNKKIKYGFLNEDNEDIFFDKNEKLIEELMVESDNKRQIYKAIELLDTKYKDVVLLYYFEEKDYEEISEILRIPTNNVGVLLFRAKTKLKSLLKNYE